MNTYPAGTNPPSEEYEFISIPMLASKIEALTKSLIDAGVSYRMGAKANPLSLQAGQFAAIDCSGFTRWAIYHASGGTCTLPDGSVNQRQWCIDKKFKVSDVPSAALRDGAIRLAFLTPEDAVKAGLPASERHVMLVTDGFTDESHGGAGPDERQWLSKPWMHFDEVYVLTPPVAA